MKLGIVDLDTSHASAWLPIERTLGADVIGVWDGGSVRPLGYAQEFIQEHEIGRVFDSLESMAEAVDVAIIHGCDWDTHLAKAKIFVDAGKAVLIDKPMAGCLRDLLQMAEWGKLGARICGGSSLRYAPELLTWKAIPLDKRGAPHTVLSGCAVDDFNYGIHAYTLACSAMGRGVSHVRWLGGAVQQRVELCWPDGRTAWVVVGKQAGGWLPFYLTIVTERDVTQMEPQSAGLYQSYLEAVWPWLSGASEKPPCAFDVLIEPEMAALAALRSRDLGGEFVELCDLDEGTGYDGAKFAERYRT